MYSENFGKAKDALPLETINNIRKKLSILGILVTEEWMETVRGIFSVQLISTNTRLTTNGKGTSREYALASGYGEFIERLQNGVLYRYKVWLSNQENQYQGFCYAPDEKYILFNELLDYKSKAVSISLLSKANLSKYDMLKSWAMLEHNSTDQILSLPFYNITLNRKEYIPITILDHKYGTNGMCAGNSVEEAIVQGLSEILERYVNVKILEGDITPPNIPNDFLSCYPTLLNMKNRIESSGAYKVIIKDCSLNEGFPVVGMIFIDKYNSSYIVKFASHPRIEIAIERTFTEFLQGRSINQIHGLTKFHFQHPNSDMFSNKRRILEKGEGYYPDSLFRKEASYSFSLQTTKADYTNKQMFKYLTNLIEDNGYEVLIRDVSFLGFPTYYIVIPGMSEITSDNDNTIVDAKEIHFFKSKILNLQLDDNTDLNKLLEICNEKKYLDDRHVSLMLPIKMTKDFSWHQVLLSFLKSCIYLKLKMYKKAAEILNNYITILKNKSYPKTSISYYTCIAYIAEALDLDYNIIDITETLENFYNKDLIIDAIEAINNPFNSLKPFACFKCNECDYKNECLYKEIALLHRKWKDIYAKSCIEQDTLRDVLCRVHIE